MCLEYQEPDLEYQQPDQKDLDIKCKTQLCLCFTIGGKLHVYYHIKASKNGGLGVLVYPIPKGIKVAEPMKRGSTIDWCLAKSLAKLKDPKRWRPRPMYRSLGAVRTRSIGPQVERVGHFESGVKFIVRFPTDAEQPKSGKHALDSTWDQIIQMMKVTQDGQVRDYAPIFFKIDPETKAVAPESKAAFLKFLQNEANFGGQTDVLICLPPVSSKGRVQNTGTFFINFEYPKVPKELVLLGAGEDQHNHPTSEESTYIIVSNRGCTLGSSITLEPAVNIQEIHKIDRPIVADAIKDITDQMEEQNACLRGLLSKPDYDFTSNGVFVREIDEEKDIPAGTLTLKLQMIQPPPKTTASNPLDTPAQREELLTKIQGIMTELKTRGQLATLLTELQTIRSKMDQTGSRKKRKRQRDDTTDQVQIQRPPAIKRSKSSVV